MVSKWLAFILVFIIFNVVSSHKRLIQVHDPNLDIALLFDETYHMKLTNYKKVYEGLKEWIKEYFKSNQTRFAFVGCPSAIPRMLFKESTSEENVMKHFPSDIVGFSEFKLPDECFEVAMNKVFQHNNGDRPLSDNVLFYITDCADNDPVQYRDHISVRVTNQIRNIVRFFGIICTQVCVNDKCASKQRGMKPTIMQWLGNDESKLITFVNADSFRLYLDKVLPKIDMEVEDCEYINMSSGCSFNVEYDKCENVVKTIITVPGRPINYAKMCPVNESTIVHECCKCECACGRNPWIPDSNCSVTCGDGIQIFRRNVSHNPTCNDVEERQCHMDCDPTKHLVNTSLNRNTTEEHDCHYCKTTFMCIAVGSVLYLILICIIGYLIFKLCHQRKSSSGQGKETVKFVKSVLSDSSDYDPFVEANVAIELTNHDDEPEFHKEDKEN